MTTIQLYKKGNAVGPIEQEGSIPYGNRLIADEGYTLQKQGTEITAPCIDVYPGDESVWVEIEETPEPEEEISYEELGKILIGGEE